MIFTEEEYFNPSKPMRKRILVTLEISKALDVDIEGVDDNAVIDEDGFADVEENLPEETQWDALTQQHIMPYEAYKYVGDKAVVKDLQGWDVNNVELEME